MSSAEGAPLVAFIEVMRRLRAQCPWKAEQTHRSLARYLLEETHETLEAIEVGDPAHLQEELGDLLLQIYFHSAIASESGEFTIDDVAAGLTEKMVRRNPHVFGSGPADLTAAQVNDQWQLAKADEKQRSSITDGLPPGLPALLYADKVLDRLERAGEQVSGESATSEVSVAQREHQVGQRLLDLVREARAQGVDPEQALREAVRREVTAADG